MCVDTGIKVSCRVDPKCNKTFPRGDLRNRHEERHRNKIRRAILKKHSLSPQIAPASPVTSNNADFSNHSNIIPKSSSVQPPQIAESMIVFSGNYTELETMGNTGFFAHEPSHDTWKFDAIGTSYSTRSNDVPVFEDGHSFMPYPIVSSQSR